MQICWNFGRQARLFLWTKIHLADTAKPVSMLANPTSRIVKGDLMLLIGFLRNMKSFVLCTAVIDVVR
jgi:hypothetical protein